MEVASVCVAISENVWLLYRADPDFCKGGQNKVECLSVGEFTYSVQSTLWNLKNILKLVATKTRAKTKMNFCTKTTLHWVQISQNLSLVQQFSCFRKHQT